MKIKHKYLLSIFSIILCVLFTVGAVYAWFVFNAKSNELFSYVGDIDLACEVYVAVDRVNSENIEIPDGIPDVTQFLPGENMTRSEILDDYYLTMKQAKKLNEENSESGSDYFNNIYVGRQLLYKIVIVNNSKTRNNALISVSFSDMSGYIKNCVEKYLAESVHNSTEYDDFFKYNSARLLFNINSVNATLYEDTPDYNTRLQDQPEQNQFMQEYLPLWKYSAGEYYSWTNTEGDEYNGQFINGVILNYGCLLELDFSLACELYTEEFTNYINASQDIYYNKFSWGNNYSAQQIKDAISAIASMESLYVIQDNDGSSSARQLDFTISNIIIRGEQRP